jgi:sulfoquinovosidase
MRSYALLFVIALAACSEQPSRGVGDFQAVLDGRGVTFSNKRDLRTLLASSLDTDGAYAPIAAGKGKTRIEMQYGSWRFTEAATEWSKVTQARWTGTRTLEWLDGNDKLVASIDATAPKDGVLELHVKAADANVDRLSLAFTCDANLHFAGFGAQADQLDHRGHKVPIWVSEPGIGKAATDDPGELWMLEGARHASSFGLPTWLSSDGYVGAVSSDARMVFELCSARDDAWRMEVWSNEFTFTLYDGPEPLTALERATEGVLGRPPQPPPLAFAPWNDAIHGSAKVREIAQLLRDNQIPSSALWTEDFRGGADVPGQGYRLKEEWAIDRTLYPDVEALAAELRGNGFAWFAYFNTFVVEKTRVESEALANGYLIKDPSGAPYYFSGVTFVPSSLTDLSNPAARDWMKSYLNAALDAGFDGWMADFAEWLPHDAQLSDGANPLLAHNRYPADWARLNREVLDARASEGKQRLFFSRSGWLGSTRDTPVVWAGDQRTSFQKDDGLYTVIPMGLGLGLGGVSTYGSDIAGYNSATNPPSTKELFFRWTSLGALTPVMRTHHGLNADANWWFGKDAETLAHYKKWATFHQQLFPYLDGSSVLAETRGFPLMRALVLEWPDTASAWKANDSYLLGAQLFVAPVVDEGKTEREVWLPPGNWYPLFGGAKVDGNRVVTLPAAVGEIPVFAREGTVLPLLPASVQSVIPQPPDDAREVWVFPAEGAKFTERDGTVWSIDAATIVGPPKEGTVTLAVCANATERGCYLNEAQSRRRFKLQGAGDLSVDGYRLRYTRTKDRTIDVVWQPR